MPVRDRGGKWEWRFKVNGHEWSHITDLAATERNKIKAQRLEAEARRLVLEGRGEELSISVQPFSSASEAFKKWAEGEYQEHPNTWKRLRGSMTSAEVFFGKQPLSAITDGDLEDYKSWRRRTHKVREVTLRHDLHAMSSLFQYGIKHQWCKRNPVERVEIPSDREAVRINVLTHEQEKAYFAECETFRIEKAAAKRTREARGAQDLADLHRLMLLQGCRPEELRALEQVDVDLEHGKFSVALKTPAGARTLKMREESRLIFARRLQTPGRWVFPSHKNPGKHIGQHQRLQAAIVKRAKVPCVPYDFRHTFASRAANEENVPLSVLASIMGHANLRSIMKYVHVQQRDMDREIGRLDTPRPLPAGRPLEGAGNGEELGKPGNSRESGKIQ
jgi:integrase